MRKLNELLAQLCPNGVETKKIADVARVERGRRVVREQLSQESGYPVYQNSLTAMGFHIESNYPENTTFVIGAGAAGEIGYSTEAFWAADDCFPIVCSSAILDRYVFHILMWQKSFIASKVRKASIPRLSRDVIENLTIPVPPVEIQSEIVRILDHYEEITIQLRKELEAELIARQKQYEYYRDALLTFADVRGGGTHEVVWRSLEEIADIGTGSSNTNEGLEEGAYPFYVRSSEVLRKNEYEFDEIAVITAGDGVGVGKVFHYVDGKYALHQRAYRIHINAPNVLPRFFFHYMRATFLPYIQKNMYQGAVASIRRPMLNAYPVPVPPVVEQKRIVNILDRFDVAYNDIMQGLPAEIEARQKQYEYYRDKLLTFPEYSA